MEALRSLRRAGLLRVFLGVEIYLYETPKFGNDSLLSLVIISYWFLNI